MIFRKLKTRQELSLLPRGKCLTGSGPLSESQKFLAVGFKDSCCTISSWGVVWGPCRSQAILKSSNLVNVTLHMPLIWIISWGDLFLQIHALENECALITCVILWYGLQDYVFLSTTWIFLKLYLVRTVPRNGRIWQADGDSSSAVWLLLGIPWETYQASFHITPSLEAGATLWWMILLAPLVLFSFFSS